MLATEGELQPPQAGADGEVNSQWDVDSQWDAAVTNGLRIARSQNFVLKSLNESIFLTGSQ